MNDSAVMNTDSEIAYQNKDITAKYLMELIILPLTVKGIEAKRELVVEAIEIAKAIKNEKQRLYTISGILTFSDKFIDKKFAQKVRENIMILQVIQSIIRACLKIAF